MRPDSAILLAAGRGKRQRPYTDITPKPLLEIEGRATLDYILCALARAGISRVCIVTHHLEEKIRDFAGDGTKWDMEISYTHQPFLRGSGDALMCVPVNWRPEGPVLIAATDYALEEKSLLELVEAHERHKADISMILKECPVVELMARSCVKVDNGWRVKRIIEKPGKDEISSPYAASFLFILPAVFWNYLPDVQPSSRGEIEMQSAVDAMLRDGYKAFGLLQPAPVEWSPGQSESSASKRTKINTL